MKEKKNILILIHQYLNNIGFQDSAARLSEEINLELENYSVVDNMDLLLINLYSFKFYK